MRRFTIKSYKRVSSRINKIDFSVYMTEDCLPVKHVNKTIGAKVYGHDFTRD